MNNDLISREALKKEVSKLILNWNDKTEYGQARISSYEFVLELIDNAPTVDIKDQIAGAYNEGYMCGNKEAEKARPQGELADEVWKLYEKHHSHLATHVLEFGDELKELLGKYQKGGA